MLFRSHPDTWSGGQRARLKAIEVMGQGVYLLLSVSLVEIVCSSGTFLIRCLQSFARFRRYFNDCLSKKQPSSLL